jgi:threonine aldolase
MNLVDRDLKSRCTRFLSSHRPKTPRTILENLAANTPADELTDFYGSGGAVARLEKQTAKLLGKEEGTFFIKGVSAQLSVLSAYAEARAARGVALHPLSHLDFDEQNAIERIGQLEVIRLGRHAPFNVSDLELINTPLAAVVIELPLRRAGYLLPDLESLIAISDWCREHRTPLHLDGARLWEAAAGYGVSVDTLAALADSFMSPSTKDWAASVAPW